MQSITIKYTPILVLTAFLLHLVWENAQASLFAGYVSFAQHFPMCFLATIGDVIFTLLIYIAVSLLKNDFGWIVRLSKTDMVVLAAMGFFYAVGIEWRALLFEKWSYADAMPIVPYFNVGLTPILQMSVLLPISFYLAKLFNKKLVAKKVL